MEQVAGGDLTVQPRAGGSGEVGRLFGSLTSMIDRLRQTVGRVRDSAESIQTASRGFAVVASEVRSLAQRSAEAAKEIKSLIGTSVDKVEVGAKLVQDAGTTMQEIVASVQRVSDII